MTTFASANRAPRASGPLASLAFLFLLQAVCAPGSAATLDGYHFRKTFEGWPETKVLRGMVVTRAPAYRIEFDVEDNPRPYDAIVSEDGEHEIALNREHKTYFDQTAMRSPSSLTSSLLHLLPVGEGNATAINIRVGEAVEESLEGRAVRRTTVDFDYSVKIDVGRSAVSGRVEATATFWMTDGISLPLPIDLRPRVQTGFPEVDAAVAKALAGIQGFPLKQELRVASKPEGEPGSTERIEVVLYSFKASDCNAACFQVPAGFLLREPQRSDPEVETRVVPAVP